ncbi:unnamed protein product [Notodromas monacha]|uniref:Probable RNA-binding protein EIF1AD n=1 Tax=Notodromas monacha TaxID=399045 RepID=A0A7R9G823_9CRUS|nr:unnamed protein product [Notodromas monacha]CAG0912666.1 unnamed protein product [Notodromas monacha]
MSRATKKKYVAHEVLNEFAVPKPPEQIAKVLGSRGNNLHDVTTSDGATFLASMPTKFRRNVWVKRGDFVVVIPIEEGDKVKAEIARILYHDQIRYIRSQNEWPAEFDIPDETASGKVDSEDSGSESDNEASSDNFLENFQKGIPEVPPDILHICRMLFEDNHDFMKPNALEGISQSTKLNSLDLGGNLKNFRPKGFENLSDCEEKLNKVEVRRNLECIWREGNVTSISEQVTQAVHESKGGLNNLFRDVCRRIPKMIDCIGELIHIIESSQTIDERKSSAALRDQLNSAFHYICSDDGTKIALFFAKGGLECLEGVSERLQMCSGLKTGSLEAIFSMHGLQGSGGFSERLARYCRTNAFDVQVNLSKIKMQEYEKKLQQYREREKELSDRARDLKKSLDSKPTQAELKSASLLAEKHVAAVVEELEARVQKQDEFINRLSIEKKALEDSVVSFRSLVHQLEADVQTSDESLLRAEAEVKNYKYFGSEILGRTAKLKRRLNAYTKDFRTLLTALSESLESQDLMPIFLVGALSCENFGSLMESEACRNLEDYLASMEHFCDELVDGRSEVLAIFNGIVDACVTLTAQNTMPSSCAVQ